jgi:hypothetical protein
MAGGGGWVKGWKRLWTFNKKVKHFAKICFQIYENFTPIFSHFSISNMPMISEAFKREIKDKKISN